MTDSPLLDRRHLDFLLHEVFDVAALCRHPRYAAHSPADFDAIIEAAHALAIAKFLPHNRASDVHEPEFADGRVRILPAVKQALDAYAEAGFPAAVADAEDGGLQLPYAVSLCCDAMFAAANVSTAGYTMLARGVGNLLKACASPDQQRRYLRPILEGRWLGTMCLSEPQAGSSLGDIGTTALPQADGSYRIKGAKMWISGGDHELSENIVHMVLARIPGGPPGVKGISLFIVPRWRVEDDGSRGARNDVKLAGVNHKLGQRGIVNTFLKFGEDDDCHAELVGAPHQGLAQMFHMMNEARIGVSVGAIMLASAGYRYALRYAKERRQGRHPDQKDPASPPLAIIEHADVRRMLLRQKCIGEGALALALQAALWVDQQAQDGDEGARREAGLLLEFITPILKAWSAEWCTLANDLAVQVLGGYGYTREYPVEQFLRDNRLNPIHEGANGIQAIDLLGRKLMMADGAGFKLLAERMQRDVAAAKDIEELRELAGEFESCLALARETTQALATTLKRGELRLGLANASHYLNVIGHLCIAWQWLRKAGVAARATPRHDADRDFYSGQAQACRFFFRQEVPAIRGWARILQSLEPSALEMRPEWF